MVEHGRSSTVLRRSARRSEVRSSVRRSAPACFRLSARTRT